jgi:hypothetical protein
VNVRVKSALVLAAVVAGGCSSISMRAPEARPPILLGPVACMGCAPASAPGAASPAITGGVHEREYIFPFFGAVASGKDKHRTAPLDAVAAKAVSDPCREDLRVSGLRAGTWGFHVPLLFGMGDTWAEAQASLAPVPNGTCRQTPAPGSSSAAPPSQKARAGSRP